MLSCAFSIRHTDLQPQGRNTCEDCPHSVLCHPWSCTDCYLRQGEFRMCGSNYATFGENSKCLASLSRKKSSFIAACRFWPWCCSALVRSGRPTPNRRKAARETRKRL